MTKKLWNDGEYIIVFFLYRFGYEELGINYTRIAQILKRTPDSIIMRFANFLSVENKESGLSGGGEKVKEIYNKYKDTPKDDLRKMAINYLIKAAEG